MTPAAPGAPTRDLFLLCGGGTTAKAIIEELNLTGRRFVVIEKSREACARLREFLPADRVVEADATDEEVLIRAGVREARALMATLHEDKLNLVIAVTALQCNPSLRVVARGHEEGNLPRLEKAGAVVVSADRIGGRRLAAAMIHHEATVFLNEMLSAPSEKPTRVEAVVVTAGGGAAGRTLGELDPFGRTGLQVVALCRGEGGPFLYNPPDDTRLAAEDRLLVIGDFEKVDRLAGIAGRWE